MLDPSVTETHAQIVEAARVLRDGGLVAFPTETVYGLGADATQPQAVARIFETKGRPRFDPLIVHVPSEAEVETVARRISPAARRLMARFWPGPLTLVLPKRRSIPDIVTAGLDTVAVRAPDHPVAQALLREAAVPVAAPSANRFGAVSPTTAEHVRDQLDLPVVLDGGACRVGIESTVVAFVDGRATLLRAGGVPREDLRAVIHEIDLPPPTALASLSPGRQTKHYAPRIPLIVGAHAPEGVRAGLLTLGFPDDPASWAAVEVLSPQGDLREAAARLFAALRRLEARTLDVIVARPVPETGLGAAIMDRLRRASG